MENDAEAPRAVTSWACGFLTLATFGAAVPMSVSFLPDAIHLWRRQGEPRPALVDPRSNTVRTEQVGVAAVRQLDGVAIA